MTRDRVATVVGKQLVIPGSQLKGSMSPDDVAKYLARCGKPWSKLPHVLQRFKRFGIPPNVLKPALSAFTTALKQETVLSTIDMDDARLQRFIYDMEDSSNSDALDIWFSRLFYEWVAHPQTFSSLSKVIPVSTITSMAELFRSADMSDPSSTYPISRATPRRKVIMHVGPTNSGKTHNALRALAAARVGCYAGPLRLLAHEIFERLNKGQIAPLGVDLDADAEPDTESTVDMDPTEGEKVVMRKEGNPAWARACNLVTGEEQKVVDVQAGLVSCTVEMISTMVRHDVVVVDEIQLLSDPDRGGAWTTAVLGVNARELHLCGEEAAVPLVEAMLRDTGDELVVNRYERLTPLKVAETSLEGDLSKVKKGDCIVSFSRSGIFALKKQVEQASGRKCAVAYGRLPPEIRSEQASLFNDPNSGYDILIGSDAIGMGLNLKIKRIIFEAVTKYDGRRERPLSIPQFKQIAGRAGRYGLHGFDDEGGICTTLYEPDLPVLDDALAVPPVPLRKAYITGNINLHSDILQALPSDASLSTGMLVCKYVSKMHPSYEFEDVTTKIIATDYIDNIASDLTLEDRVLLVQAPVPWRDGAVARFMSALIKMYHEKLRVDLRELVKSSELLADLEGVQKMMAKDDKARVRSHKTDALTMMESLHKGLIAYLWLSFRNPISFSDREYAIELKEQAEKAMEWYLNVLSDKFVAQRVTKPDSKVRRVEEVGRVEKVGRIGKVEKLEKVGRVERVEKQKRLEQPSETEPPSRPKRWAMPKSVPYGKKPISTDVPQRRVRQVQP